MSESDSNSNQQQIVKKIENVLGEVRSYLVMHGGDVEFVKYENGKVYVNLKGVCSSCPSAQYTLKLLIEDSLKNSISEIKEVVQV